MSSVERFIPLSVPSLNGRECEYVKECLDSGWVSTAGPFVGRFESMFAEAVGSVGAVCTSSGTSALHVALLVAGVGREDEVLVPSMTFIAPVNSIRYVGAWPVFIDSNPNTWQMDVDLVRSFIENECRFDGRLINLTTGRRVAAVVPVHILGYPVDLAPLYEIAAKYNLLVIEDATESLGSSYHGRQLGSACRMACFSFNGNKLMTTGGGGMLTSNDPEVLRHAKHLTTQAKCEPTEYVHDEVGYNYRLPSLLAALGCAQVEQLPSFIASKRRIAARYDQAFKTSPEIHFIEPVAECDAVPWLYTVLLERGQDSRPLIAHLKANQIETRPLWQPNHLSPAHSYAQRRQCPVAENLYLQAISLPCSSHLDAADQDRVIATVLSFLAN